MIESRSWGSFGEIFGLNKTFSYGINESEARSSTSGNVYLCRPASVNFQINRLRVQLVEIDVCFETCLLQQIRIFFLMKSKQLNNLILLPPQMVNAF